MVLPSVGSPLHTLDSGGIMASIFLEGLQSAREIVQNKGIAALDELIDELSKVETADIKLKAETR